MRTSFCIHRGGKGSDAVLDVRQLPPRPLCDLLDGVDDHAGAGVVDLDVGLVELVILPEAGEIRIVDGEKEAIGGLEEVDERRGEFAAQEAPHGDEAAKVALVEVADPRYAPRPVRFPNGHRLGAANGDTTRSNKAACILDSIETPGKILSQDEKKLKKVGSFKKSWN